MKSIEFASCPVGDAAGHDGDECRASRYEDGSIACVACQTRYPRLSSTMRQVFRSIASIYGTPRVQLGSSIQPGSAAYDASCLCGYDPKLSDRVQAFFGRQGESVKLDYDMSNEAEINTPNLGFGRDATEAELALMSPSMRSCLQALASHGFRLRHISREQGTRVVLACGRPIGSMGFVLGATVELRS